MDTPVPIPNTEVKHLSGDNSMACSCEDSTLPGYLGTHLSSFFCLLVHLIYCFLTEKSEDFDCKVRFKEYNVNRLNKEDAICRYCFLF